MIDEQADELDELESLDNGKTKFLEKNVDVGGTRNYFRYMAGWATKIEGSTIDISVGGGPPGSQFQAQTRREPVGVVGIIGQQRFEFRQALDKLPVRLTEQAAEHLFALGSHRVACVDPVQDEAEPFLAAGRPRNRESSCQETVRLCRSPGRAALLQRRIERVVV